MIKEWKCVKGEMDNETWPRAQDKEWGMTHDWQTWDPKQLRCLTETPTYRMLQLFNKS